MADMKVVYVRKPGYTPPTVHTCSICGTEGYWDENWRYRYKLMGSKHDAWELEIKTCSEKCRVIDRKSKR